MKILPILIFILLQSCSLKGQESKVSKENSNSGFIAELEKKAEANDEKAMIDLAQNYLDKDPKAESNKKAFYWMKRAAKFKSKFVLANLGGMYRYGTGCEVNYDSTFHYYTLAIENGLERVKIELGLMYKNGEGVEKDIEKSFTIIKEQAERGDPQAVYELANFYYNGEYVDKNYSKALELYSLAAEGNHIESQVVAGYMYENSEGTKKDIKKAKYFYEKAAKKGHKYAIKRFEELEKNE